MTATVIVCTRNRASSLAPTLDSIRDAAAAHAGAIDLVVVDNGSTDATAGVVGDWIAANPDLPARLVQEALPGLARARNAGLRHARGSIIVFTDDDCTLALDYFDDLFRHWQGKAETPQIRGGRVELGDPRDLPFTIKLDPDPQQLTYPMHPGGFVHGCNMTISRAAIDRIGDFDVRFGAGATFIAAEDADYLYRAMNAGIPVFYEPDMTVRHFHGRRAREEMLKLHDGYNIGNGALYAKHLFRNGWIVKHFYWTLKNALRERGGGPLFDADIGLSHATIVRGNLKGFFRYWVRRS